MKEYWVLTDPFGDTPDKPILLLATDGPTIQLWAPHLTKWVDAPMYFDEIYGDDPGKVKISEETAAQYRADGVGLDQEMFDRAMKANEQYVARFAKAKATV